MLAIPSSNVSAQDRSGVTGGLSIGAGGLILRGSADDPAVEVIQQGDEQRGAASADLRLGGFVNPRLALFFELAIAFSGEKELDAPVAVRIGGTELHFADGTTDLTSNLWLVRCSSGLRHACGSAADSAPVTCRARCTWPTASS